MKTKWTKAYWENRYKTNEIGWDTGKITTPLKAYIDQLKNKDLSILIPGAGNGYEPEYLIQKGFRNVYVVDIAKAPLKNIQKRLPHLDSKYLIQADFFEFHMTFDLILEQTFFCALDPRQREDYVNQTHALLKPKGKAAGLLFQFPLTEQGPPFGGSKKEYIRLFQDRFNIKTLETSHNSIKPRENNELFFIFEKK